MNLHKLSERITTMRNEKLEILKQYSRGELRRFDAMKQLDMTYSELLREMEDHKLPMFHLPEERLQEMASEFTEVMKGRL